MQTLHANLLAIEELSTATSRLLPIIKPLIASNTILTDIAAAAETNQSAISLALSRQDTSEYTTRFKELDAKRDDAFTSLRNYCAAGVKNLTYTPEQRAASTRLVKIFSHHGNSLHSLGYNRQTGKMNALITDLSTPAATTDLTLLGHLPLFNFMVTAQTDFENMVAEKAGQEDLPTLGAHRPPLERRLNLLLNAIEEWHDLSPTPASTTAIGQIDEIIINIATPALSRRTKAEQEPSTPPPSAPAP